MNVLITGGAGFIGSLLARTLLARDALDGRPIERLVLADRVEPPADLLADARVRVAVGPLLAQGEDIAGARYDAVFHLAARASVARSVAQPRETFETNVLGTLNVVEAVRERAPRARVLVASSGDVYGAAATLSS